MSKRSEIIDYQAGRSVNLNGEPRDGRRNVTKRFWWILGMFVHSTPLVVFGHAVADGFRLPPSPNVASPHTIVFMTIWALATVAVACRYFRHEWDGW